MKTVKLEEKTIYGVKTRTTNENEMNPQTAKIGAIWQKFDSSVSVDYQGGEKVYGVYSNYESDASGEFDVLAGYEKPSEGLDSVKIEKGKYLVFSKEFEGSDDSSRIQAVIATWGEIWEYFLDESSEYKRAYKSDFEFYKSQNEIEIHISI